MTRYGLCQSSFEADGTGEHTLTVLPDLFMGNASGLAGYYDDSLLASDAENVCEDKGLQRAMLGNSMQDDGIVGTAGEDNVTMYLCLQVR